MPWCSLSMFTTCYDYVEQLHSTSFIFHRASPINLYSNALSCKMHGICKKSDSFHCFCQVLNVYDPAEKLCISEVEIASSQKLVQTILTSSLTKYFNSLFAPVNLNCRKEILEYARSLIVFNGFAKNI